MPYELILSVVTDFYAKAKVDILIGFQFRNIENFDSHIPRIADFWQLQLNGKLDNINSLPFKLMEVHKPLQIKKGQMDRWVLLFHQTLNEYRFANKLSDQQQYMWMGKIKHFRDKMQKVLHINSNEPS